MCRNFHDFYRIRNDSKAHATAHASMYQMKVLNRNGSISDEEWEISRMYMAVKFRKIRESTMEYNDESDEEASKDDDDSDSDAVQEAGSDLKGETAAPRDSAAGLLLDVDVKTKSKLMPMAMLKAKRQVSLDEWNALSSLEKTRLTEIELLKML
jgi:hypothetical protein